MCVVVTCDCLIDYFVDVFARWLCKLELVVILEKKKMQNARLQRVGREKNNKAKVHIDSL